MLIGLGEALIDVLPDGEVIGGAPLNFSIRAAELAERCGRNVALISRVGSDQRGRRVLELLRERRVSVDFVQNDQQHPTGFVDIQIADGEASYQFASDTAWDHLETNSEMLAVAAECSLVCFGSLAQRGSRSRATIKEFLSSARNAIKVFDINLRKPLPEFTTVLSSLEHADVLKCNAEELLWLAAHLGWGESDADAISCLLCERFGLHCVFRTQGAEGCIWHDGQRPWRAGASLDIGPFLPAEKAPDTVGAGDAACAALAVGLVERWTPQKIVLVANICGAFAARTRGPTVGMPEDLIARLHEEFKEM